MFKKLSLLSAVLICVTLLTPILTATPATAQEFNEAPMLKELVDAGELPPVEERLPEEPLVVEPIEAIGQYGGTWHRAFLGSTDIEGSPD